MGDLKINCCPSFGMRKVPSLRSWARKNPDKVVVIDSKKMEKARKSIEQALRYVKGERFRAKDSASNIVLSV